MSTTAGELHRHRWDPPAGATPRPCGVYLLHGIGEHAGRYERLAARLVREGWSVAAHDHRGHGRSGGARGVALPPDRLVADARGELERFAERTGSEPVLFGHSLGGVVATEIALERGVALAGLALSAPAIVPRLTATDRLKLRLMTTLAPSRALELPYDANRLTHDPVEIAAAHADELVHGFKSAGLVNWLIGSARRALERAPEIDVPTLLLIAGEDLLIDTAETIAFAERLPAPGPTVHRYEGYRHELLNETTDRRERVTADIVRWLESLESGR